MFILNNTKELKIALVLILLTFFLLFNNNIVLSFEKTPSIKKGVVNENIIAICCAWGTEIKKGVLTYSIKGSNKSLDSAVINAVDIWNNNLNGLQFEKAIGKANIQITFINDGKMFAGKTTYVLDGNGYIKKINIVISKESFNKQYDFLQLERTLEHELGHALGLGHANFNGNLMSMTTSTSTGVISPCVIDAVDTANAWKLKDGGSTIHGPTKSYVIC